MLNVGYYQLQCTIANLDKTLTELCQELTLLSRNAYADHLSRPLIYAARFDGESTVVNVAGVAMLQVPNSSPRWTEFISHWPLWSIYVAHFCMNWSNYIIMQWLPTYMARNLGANTHDIMFTAIPYLLNSLIGVSK